MQVLKGILSESGKYYADIERKIKKKILELPKGGIKKRIIRGNVYYYLQTRTGNKVIHKYAGKEKPIDLIKKIKERQKLKADLKVIRQNRNIIKKAESVKSGRYNK